MMKKLMSLIVLVTSIANAQYSVRGTMTPPDKGDWVMLHKLQGVTPKYIANTTIKFDTVNVGGDKQVLGKFSLELPKNAESGVYRATYRNKGAGFVDFLFNKENVEFIFNPKFPDQSVVFTSSRENKLYNEYLEAYALIQKKIDSLQMEYLKTLAKDTKRAYKKELNNLEDLQELYENKSEGMLTHEFIKASQRYNPSSIIDNMPDYMSSTMDNFFKFVNFDNKTLYQSSFLVDRVNDYVFYLNSSEDQITQQELYKKSINRVMDIIDNKRVKKEILEFLVNTYAERRNSEIVDWLFSEYYDKLSNKDSSFKAKKLDQLSVSVGRPAPDFSWKENGKDYRLSTLNEKQYYLMIFWSTACPHCVKEIPEVHSFMQSFSNTSVISFAIEDNDVEFNKFKQKLPGWHNVIGTHPTYKFDNEIVKKYKIDATPTYFVLDANKKIIAVPNTVKDVQQFFKNLK
ncbi:TlpA disulfide reductase family protein [Tenacibaculum sp. 190524A02b]|uniref:TlpA family protein disulfide reductase n=1 Tax=Tenacibaculum vairaonense TaxID=3137860 RepID=UPI0032B0FBEC